MLFRRKSSNLVVDLGFYGKLPQFADFVQHHATHEPVRALDEWLQAGLAALRASGEGIADDYGEVPHVRFLWHGREAGSCLVGAFRTSADRSGRRYPFIVFALLDCAAGARWHARAPIAFAALLERASALLDQAPQAPGPQTLVDRIEALEPPSPEALDAAAETYEGFVRETRTHDFLDGALPDQPEEIRLRLASRLYSLYAPLRKRSLAASPLAVRYPLAADAPAPFAAFWLELSAELAGGKSPQPVAFWMPEADRPFLLAPLGRPSAKTFLHLLRDDVPDESLCDLTAPSERPIHPEARSLALVEEPPLLLHEVLARANP